MPGKRIRIDDEMWTALMLLGQDTSKDFQDLADEAFSDLLKKYHRPVTLTGGPEAEHARHCGPMIQGSGKKVVKKRR